MQCHCHCKSNCTTAKPEQFNHCTSCNRAGPRYCREKHVWVASNLGLYPPQLPHSETDTAAPWLHQQTRSWHSKRSHGEQPQLGECPQLWAIGNLATWAKLKDRLPQETGLRVARSSYRGGSPWGEGQVAITRVAHGQHDLQVSFPHLANALLPAWTQVRATGAPGPQHGEQTTETTTSTG